MIIFLALILIFLVILIGGERGAMSIMTLAGNIVILFFSIMLMSAGFPVLLLILVAGAGVCYISLFYQNGNNPKTRAAFLATLLVMLLLFIPIYIITWRSKNSAISLGLIMEYSVNIFNAEWEPYFFTGRIPVI